MIPQDIPDITKAGEYIESHTHAFFKTFDFYGTGKPTRIAFAERDVREDDKYLEPSTRRYCFSVPWFKHFDKQWIEKFAEAFKKVIENHEQLLEGDTDKAEGGRWFGTSNE